MSTFRNSQPTKPRTQGQPYKLSPWERERIYGQIKGMPDQRSLSRLDLLFVAFGVFVISYFAAHFIGMAGQ